MREHGRWSFGNEDGWDAYAADDAAAAAEFEQERLLREAEELRQLNEQPEGDSDAYARDADFWRRVFRHLPCVPNPDHRKAVEAWLLRDLHESPSLRYGGCLQGATLRAASIELHAANVRVWDGNGRPVPRSLGSGLPDGAFYPQQVMDYVVAGVGFCLATEMWLTQPTVRERGWEVLLETCESWFRADLRSKKSFTKRSSQ